jgi:hypothetical protein
LIRARHTFQFATASYRPGTCNQRRARLGQLCHEHVRVQLLITSSLERYMTLFLDLLFPA